MSVEDKPKFVPENRVYRGSEMTEEEKEFFSNLVEIPITFTGECSIFEEDGTEVKISGGEKE
jgi:hypothetical protein